MTNLLNKEDIRRALQDQPFKNLLGHYPTELLSGSPRPAAVLIPLVCTNAGWQVLFIRRTEVEGDLHSGQVALPGGRRDRKDESLTATALRETQEELGIMPDDIEILGQLNEFIAISNYRVTPFVGTLAWPYPIVPDAREVAHWFTIPLGWLQDENNRRTEMRILPNGRGDVSVIYFERYQGELLWGLSARIITELLTVISSRQSAARRR
ncbi:MAG: CoA pyrophosphatase [Anaerolineales bacterium]|nr:CoA pyrophosphatase [Anaerolineales bacterium]